MDTLNETVVNANYWRQYGFSCDPFCNIDKSEFFIPPSWEEYLDLLPQFARFCDTLLLITGQQNVGKTTLINLFLHEQIPAVDVFKLCASDCLNANHFLQLLSQRYGAPYDANHPAPASEQLHQQLEYLRENKAARLLIIDNAEQLPLDMRQLCLQIIQQQNALTTCLPIILVGEENLSAQMHALLTPTTAQKCLYIIQVEPFTEDETEQYLKWCCAQATNKEIDFPFSPEDVITIFQASRGRVGEINPTAQRLLSSRTKNGIRLTPYLRSKLVWWLGALTVITLLLFTYRQLTKPTVLNIPEPINQAAPTQISAPPATTTPVAATAKTTPTTTHATALNAPGPLPAPTPNSGRLTNSSGATAAPATDPAKPAVAAEGASSEDLPHTNASTTATSVSEPTSNLATKPTTSSLPMSSVSEKTAVPTRAAMTTQPAKKSIPPTNLFASSMTQELHAHQIRINHINPQHYTLQLLASPNLHVIQQFVLKHHLESIALIVRTERAGKYNYIVLYGDFPSRSAASQQQAKLQQTHHIQAWVRTYKSVQALLGTEKTTKESHPRKVGQHHLAEQSNNAENW